MIIRRLAEGIKNQDWFVVMVEVMIVVVGIFIGLQVDDWNDARKDDLRTVEVLEDLRVDFVAIEQNVAKLKKYYVGLIADMEVLVKSMNAGALLPKDEKAVYRAMTTGDVFGDPPPLSGTFRDLIGSGNLALIRDKELRLALADFDQSPDIIQESDLNINVLLGYYGDAFKRHSRLDPNYVLPDEEIANFTDVLFPPVASIDFEAMQNDPEFRVAAEQLMRMQIIRYFNSKLAHDKVLRVQELLAHNMKANQ